MAASFLITLREGLEIALVLVIVLSYLVKSGRKSETGAVWKGAGLAAVLCLVAGIAVHAAVGGLHGTAAKVTEGIIALAAASVLTWMIFWMRGHARNLGSELRAQIDSATTVRTLALVAFVAVVREGLETALFLLGADTNEATGTSVVVGGLLGLAVAAVLGVALYKGSHRVNLRVFFTTTGLLLILFAAGLFGKSVHEFREALGWESGWLFSNAWTVESGLWASGTFYDFMKGFFGWHAETENIRLLVWAAYLVPVTVLFVRGARDSAKA